MHLLNKHVHFFNLHLFSIPCSFSALIKQVNKSIDGTADDEEEGVPTEEAIRAGLELLKVKYKLWAVLPVYLHVLLLPSSPLTN